MILHEVRIGPDLDQAQTITVLVVDDDLCIAVPQVTCIQVCRPVFIQFLRIQFFSSRISFVIDKMIARRNFTFPFFHQESCTIHQLRYLNGITILYLIDGAARRSIEARFLVFCLPFIRRQLTFIVIQQ